MPEGGLACVERQYDSEVMSAVIEPAFEQWKRKPTRLRTSRGAPLLLIAGMMLVAYFAVVWAV